MAKKRQKESRRVQALMAARKLVAKGWVKNFQRLEGEDGVAYCATGAIAEIAGEFRVSGEKLVHVLATSLPKRSGTFRTARFGHMDDADRVQSFNDNFSTTKTQVLRMFDRAIRSLKS